MYEGIPAAVAAIVNAMPRGIGSTPNEAEIHQMQKRTVDFVDQLTRAFAKALTEAVKAS